MAPRLIDGVPPRYPQGKEVDAEEASLKLKSEISLFLDNAEKIITAREELDRRCQSKSNAWANAERKRLVLDGMTIPPIPVGWRDSIEAEVRDEIVAEYGIDERSAAPRLQISAAAGTGKTTKLIKMISERPFLRSRYIDYYVPTTDLADELKHECHRLRLDARVFKGRSNGAPEDPMCERYEVAEKAARLGIGVYGTLCKREIGGQELICPFYSDCPYIDQWRDRSPGIRIFAHNYLGLQRPTPDGHSLPKPDLVIVDENAVHRLIGKCDFGIDRLDGPAAAAVRDHIDNGIDLRRALRIRGVTAASARKIADELTDGIKTDVTPDMPESEASKRLDKAKRAELHKLVKFWQRIAVEIGFNRPFHGIEICKNEPVKIDGKPEHQHRIHVYWPIIPVIGKTVPLLMIDADADLETNRIFFGPTLKSVEIRAKRNAHVIQCYSTRLSKTALLGLTDKAKPSLPQPLRKVLKIIDAEVKRGGKVLVVMPRKVRVFVTCETGKLLRSVKWRGATIAHFNYIRGSNNWADHDAVIIVGREQPVAKDIERVARAIWADSDEPLKFMGGGRYGGKPLGYRMRDGSLKGVMTPVHPDPRIQSVLELIRELEMVQSIDRIRLIHAKKTKRVIILCSIPLDITVDELKSLDELAGTPGRLGWHARMKRIIDSIGMLPLGKRDLYRVVRGHPDDLISSEDYAAYALKKARRAVRNGGGDNGDINQLVYIIGNDPHLRIAKYRRFGQRGRDSYVLYDIRRSCNPLAHLSLMLLELVVKFEDLPMDDD